MTHDEPGNAACWAPTSAVGRSFLPETDVDVVVVGAGLAGCSTALFLAEQRPELRVALIDARAPAAGASGRGTGLLGPRLGPPIEMARRRFGDAIARSLHLRSESAVRLALAVASRHVPMAVTTCRGQLMTGFHRNARAVILRRARAYHELGLDVTLQAAGARALPADASTPALRFREAAGVDPVAFTVGLARGAARLGVSVVHRTVVTGLQPSGAGLTRVVTSRGSLSARAVVVTVDAAEPGLGLSLRGLISLEVCAQATAVLPEHLLAELGGPASPQVLSADPMGAYRRITPDGQVVIGGGPAILWPGLSPDQLRRRRRAVWQLQASWLSQVHPDLVSIPIEHHWSGRVTITRDGLPILGRAGMPGEVWYAGGWNGHGLAATVAAGAHLADLVLRNTPPEADIVWRPARRWVLALRAAQPVVRGALAIKARRLDAPVRVEAPCREAARQVA